MISRSATKEFNFENAKVYGKASKYISIAGITLAMLLLLAFILYVIVVFAIVGAALRADWSIDWGDSDWESSDKEGEEDEDGGAHVALYSKWILSVCVCLSVIL